MGLLVQSNTHRNPNQRLLASKISMASFFDTISSVLVHARDQVHSLFVGNSGTTTLGASSLSEIRPSAPFNFSVLPSIPAIHHGARQDEWPDFEATLHPPRSLGASLETLVPRSSGYPGINSFAQETSHRDVEANTPRLDAPLPWIIWRWRFRTFSFLGLPFVSFPVRATPGEIQRMQEWWRSGVRREKMRMWVQWMACLLAIAGIAGLITWLALAKARGSSPNQRTYDSLSKSDFHDLRGISSP